MNHYTIADTWGTPLAAVYAITPGAAVIAFRSMHPHHTCVVAHRTPDLRDAIAQEAADTHSSPDWCMANYKMDARCAYRTAHHYAREALNQQDAYNHDCAR